MSATVYALLGITLQSAYDNTVVFPRFVTTTSTDATARDYLLTLRMNPSVAGKFTYSNKTNSAVQTATGVATNTVTGGEIIWSAYASGADSFAIPANVLPRIGKAIDGTLDTLVLCAQPLTANATVAGSLNWLEQV